MWRQGGGIRTIRRQRFGVVEPGDGHDRDGHDQRGAQLLFQELGREAGVAGSGHVREISSRRVSMCVCLRLREIRTGIIPVHQTQSRRTADLIGE